MSPNCWYIPSSEEEFVDVFCEEVEELLENIDNHMKTWMNRPRDKKALTEIRRSFHTIKGSGRMVKALDLSEMAWKVENMLNQAIAGVVPVSEPMMKLIPAVRIQMSKMADAFKNRRSIAGNIDVMRLMKLADTLAAERKPEKVSAPHAIPPIGGKQHFNPHEVNLKLERCMQRADEALHRSEIALQQTRRISAQNEASYKPAEQRDCCAEANRIGERLNQLTKEISDVRAESEDGQREPILHRNEMNHLVEQRMRADLIAMELLGTEIKRNIEENRRTVIVLRRYGWLVLFLSTLTGGLLATELLMPMLSLG